MGVGKSTVGALLARRLGAVYRDTDQDVAAETGLTVAELFAREGEAGFREREHRAVARAVAEPGAVLSLGGGAVLHSGTRALLTGLPVAFLDVSAEVALRRVGDGRTRPLLAADPDRRWRELRDRRRPLYSAVARVVVPTDDRTPEEVADAVLDALELETP
ncbi:shikimate kinase [Streptomyces sp. NPDC086023]|uniref:shikimate kinase n=1 Tax=Streptomyces sp. NPDC086023 TaxID=3365746 RepID=UPI0037D950DB